MKKAEWRAVYAPRGDMLEKRVRQTLMQLEDKPTHARPKRMVWLAAALVLVLAAGSISSVPFRQQLWPWRRG